MCVHSLGGASLVAKRVRESKREREREREREKDMLAFFILQHDFVTCFFVDHRTAGYLA